MNYEHFICDPKRDLGFNKNEVDLISLDPEQMRFTQMVFAPDPVTGNPSSEISYLLKGDDPDFQQWIKEKLFMPTLLSSAELASTAEEAEALVKRNLCTPNQFEIICKSYVNNLLNKDKE